MLRPPIESAQYTSFRLAEHLDTAGIAASIGSVGDAYDNALMESMIGLFKAELIKPRRPWSGDRQDLAVTPKNAARWPTRFMTATTGKSHSAIWRAFGLQPHRVGTLELSKDSLFIDRVRDVIGLHPDPPGRPWSYAWTPSSRSRPWTDPRRSRR
ncbi:hypothetical protein [Streptomyces sp. NPDC056480]|uniref:hypothetical protein n=1 Tax=Streptomyces sp. NPDC056480 TaxID=3345833 RepID=UPI0036C71A8C